MRDPVAFLREELAPLVAEGLAQLRSGAGEGAASATVRSSFESVREALSVTLRGAGVDAARVYLVLREGAVLAAETAPADCQVRYACALPGPALGVWLGKYGAQLEPAPLAEGLQRLVHARVLGMFAANPVSFEVRVAAVPELGTLDAAFALGRAEVPAACDFRLSTTYPDLEQARAQGLGPQQMLTSGRLRLEGDVARAMGLGMMLMQLKRMSET